MPDQPRDPKTGLYMSHTTVEQRIEACKAGGIRSDVFAPLLRGDSPEELEAHAKALGAELGATPATEQEEPADTPGGWLNKALAGSAERHAAAPAEDQEPEITVGAGFDGSGHAGSGDRMPEPGAKQLDRVIRGQ